MRYKYIASLFIATVFLSACSTKPKNDYDLNYNFKALQSFSQLAPQPNDDPLSAQRIQTEITQQAKKALPKMFLPPILKSPMAYWPKTSLKTQVYL